MNELLDNKIKKIEYFFFINKIQKRIIIKKKIKRKIIIFQKRIALEHLLINVIYEMKNNILNEKLKQFLVKKFIYTIIEQYIEHYNKENNENKKNEINERNKIQNIKKSKRKFNQYLIRKNLYSFINGANICLNDQRIKLIQNEFLISNKIKKTKEYFIKLKQLKYISFYNQKKIIMSKIFFSKIKNNILQKKKNINAIKDLDNKKRLFIYKRLFTKFKYNCKLKKDKNKINEEKNKIIELRNKYTSRYFKEFICRIKIIRKVNYSLKKKIFNLFKNNVKISKDLKHYLDEASEIE
jgi:hypothetical protein